MHQGIGGPWCRILGIDDCMLYGVAIDSFPSFFGAPDGDFMLTFFLGLLQMEDI